MWQTIEINCGSIIATVVLPESVSESDAKRFADHVNSTAIVVSGTNLTSITGSVTFSVVAPSQGDTSGGTSGDDDSTGLIAGVIVAVVLVLGGVVAAAVICNARKNTETEGVVLGGIPPANTHQGFAGSSTSDQTVTTSTEVTFLEMKSAKDGHIDVKDSQFGFETNFSST